MKEYIERRAIDIGHYIIDNNSTIRAAAKVFKISKSSVHKDVSERLKKVKPQLYREVIKVLNKNKRERHLRGGEATKNKYMNIHKE